MQAQQLELVLNKIDRIILLLSAQCNILWINEMALKVLNWEKEDVMGKSFVGLCKSYGIPSPLSYDSVHNEIETQMCVNDKTEVVSWTVQNIEDSSNKSKDQLLLMGEFVTQLKALARQNYELSSIIKKVPGFVFWKDLDCILRGCNENFARQVGLQSPEDIVGKTDHDLPWTKEETRRFLRDDKAIMRTGKEKLNIEELQTQKNGKKAILLTSKTPLRDEQNNIVGVLGIYLDITDRKRAEEHRRKCEAEAAQKVINFTNLMAGSMAHELRTPLQGISIHADLIEGVLTSKQTQQEKDNMLRDVVKQIKKVIKSSTETINDMLVKIRAFAAGQLPKQNFEERSIIADIEEFLDNYPFESDQKDLVNTCYTARFKYRGDKNLTHHLLANFTKNALYAIRETDKLDAHITIETKADDDYNLVIFRDTAIGIPAEFLSQIFDQFATKKSTKGGTGLGLAFCKMIMEDYGGDIVCNSEEGKFTEFVLKFPKI